jgi:DNA-directed RNA polymerase subunit RPC12/RpoP
MLCPYVEIVCGKCGSIIGKMINLKSIKDIMHSTRDRCKVCGVALNPNEFVVKIKKN